MCVMPVYVCTLAKGKKNQMHFCLNMFKRWKNTGNWEERMSVCVCVDSKFCFVTKPVNFLFVCFSSTFVLRILSRRSTPIHTYTHTKNARYNQQGFNFTFCLSLFLASMNVLAVSVSH